ncbi:hypothetical protein GCM10010413_08640 [Promicromonospora sukumoe]|uniref:ATP-grasp domain-containing protein n=1 Tax=Promicromonospora sukumoe TaxID=88382 RepID=A0A7W3PC50_9MICO|nr:ATP-grasp domain-containing protein [Promicromonospora sukumoe]MBA8806535.1 hypothetical protein [Promicromonospora sukumoe]
MPPTIVFPRRLTASAQRVRDAADRRGLTTTSLPTSDVPGDLTADHLHAGPTFADAVAPGLGITLLEAPATWLADLPREYVGRTVTAMPVAEAWRLRSPAFVKSPNDKSMRAMIYTDGTRLPGADAVDGGTTVLVSEIVTFSAEYRFHLLDGAVRASSQYAADGALHVGPVPDVVLGRAGAMLADLAATLPSAIVVDLGDIDDGLVVVEANAAWASGTYAADPDRVLDVVLRAAGPADAVRADDRRFVRGLV